MDRWQLIRSLERQKLSVIVFMLSLLGLFGLFAALAPTDLLEPSFLPIVLLSAVAAYAAWKWSDNHS